MAHKGEQYSIYLINSEQSEYFYIGKTKNIKNRWNMHLYNSKTKSTFINRWLIKHKSTAEINVLEDNLSEKESFYFEKWYIELFKSWGLKLMNHTQGGEGISGYKHNNISKLKISQTHKDFKFSDESKKKMSNSKLKNTNNTSSNSNTRQKMSISSIKIKRNIKAYNIHGEFIGEFNSPTEIKNTLFKEISILTGEILTSCRRGRQKSVRGYIFQFSDDDKIKDILNIIQNNKKLNQQSIIQYDLTGNIVKEWDNSYQIEKELSTLEKKYNSVDIRSCCRGKQKTAFGYKWEYKDTPKLKKYNFINQSQLEKNKNEFEITENNLELDKLIKNKFIENKIYNIIKDTYKGKIIINHNKEINFYIPEKNIGFNIYNLKELSQKPNNHCIKLFNKYKNTLKIIQIFSDEIINKEDIVISRIINELGNIEEKIYARKCEIKEVNVKEKNKFLNENHIQGEDKSQFKYGLYHNNELVSIMTFRQPRIAIGGKDNIQKDIYELIRFCNKRNTTVIGGASKLLSHFIKNHTSSQIYSFADNRWSSPINNLYKTIGFTFINFSNQGYWYTNDYQTRLHRFNFNKGALAKKGQDTDNKTEREIMEELGYSRIYDCGTSRYELTF